MSAKKTTVLVCVRCDSCDEHGIKRLKGSGGHITEVTCTVCLGSKCVGEAVLLDATRREELDKYFSKSMEPCDNCHGSGTVEVPACRCKACRGTGIKRSFHPALTKIFTLSELAHNAELFPAIKARAKCTDCEGLGNTKPIIPCPVCRGTARNPNYLLVPGQKNIPLAEWLKRRKLWCKGLPAVAAKIDDKKVVAYEILCPDCGGTGESVGHDGGGPVHNICHTCKGRRVHKKGMAKIAELKMLFDGLGRSKKFACPICEGTGQNKTGRRCKRCLGFKIDALKVILHLPKGKKTLDSFLHQN